MVSGKLSRRTFAGASLAVPAAVAMPFGMTGALAQDQLVATMVTNTAGLGDQNFNDLANAGGSLAAEELGIEWRVIESVDAAAYVPNLTAAAEQGQLSIAVGFLLTPTVEAVAPQFPDRFFTIIDSVVEQPNVQSVLYKEHDAAFLTGVASGLMTQTNKLGVVGGERIPPVIRYEVGFIAGVAAVNPDAEVVVGYVDSFEDPETGKEFALSQFSDGADIVFPVAGLTGVGCYDAVAELGNQGSQWVLGADVTQDHLAPGYELAVCRKGVDTGVYQACQQVVDGAFEAGLINLGLQEGGVGFEDPNNHISEEALERVAEFEAMIIDGTLVVPATDEDLEAYMAGSPVATPAG